MQAPFVTVLMPVYNAEKFLAISINSILQQTLTDFEFLIIDDASTDRSKEIIHQFSDKRIRYHRNEENLGISASLNKGISLSKGKWIARMDADDISYPDRLQKQLRYCQENPDCALLSCWARVINEDGTAVRIEDYVSRYYYYNLCFECWIYHPTIMCRKDALESVGGYTIPYAEDYELFWQLSRRYLIWNLEEALLDYRISSGSLHKVVKKVEYDEALLDLLQRNIRYYVGDLKLSGEELECLRHNFQPLLNRNSIAAVVNCLEKLEKITEKILHTENVNRDAGAIREAAYHKRKFIINFFARNFSKWKGFLLLIRLGQWKLLQKLAKEHLGRLS